MKNQILHETREFTDARELIEWAGERYGKDIAYSYKATPHDKETVKISFEEMRRDVRALASEMLDMGCVGKHCVIIGKLSYEWALTYFAALAIGSVLVPLDRDWHADDLLDTAKNADADFLFCDEDLAETARLIDKRLKLEKRPVFLMTKNEKRSVRALCESGESKYEKNPDAYHNAKIDTEKLSLLVFTSGTTGKGKGVMLSQNAILSDVSCVIPYIDFAKKTVGLLPPHHTYCSTVMFIAHAMIGAAVYISSGLRYVQKELREERPGHLVLVPLFLETFYRKILANIKEQDKEELVFRMIKVSNAARKVGIDHRNKLFAAIREAFGGKVKTIITGGAPINQEIIHFFDSIGISVLNGYGITECAPLIAVNRSRNVVPNSVGNVIDIDRVKIDEPNEDGEGEILVAGPNVMLGYYKNEKATEKAFKDGYFRTGDYGRLDRDGILYITGRKKNLIILSNGKNVYPEEIENALASTPGIQDIVVYEGQSKRGISYNAIVAEIYPDRDFFRKNGIEDIEGYFKPFVDSYNKTAVAYKKINIIKVRDEEFPKNTLRKIMRFKLDTAIE